MPDEVFSMKQKENSLQVAYDSAAEILKKADPKEICGKTGALYEKSCYKVRFLKKLYEIKMPSVDFTPPGLPAIVEVLILHYLTAEKDAPKVKEFVNFSTIPDGMFYQKAFNRRALDKVIDRFGGDPEGLMAAGTALGGRKWTSGEYSVIVPVFPRIDLVVQLFPADEEFPVQANILFPDNIGNFLPVEDTALLGGYLVGALSRS